MKNPGNRFFSTRPLVIPGLQPSRPFTGSVAREPPTVAQPFNFFHSVQLPMACQSPQTAWPAACFALPRWFALFRDEKPVGGRGISDFQPSFFSPAWIFIQTPSATRIPLLWRRTPRKPSAGSGHAAEAISAQPAECVEVVSSLIQFRHLLENCPDRWISNSSGR